MTAAGETGLVADTNNIISQLMAINNTLPSIEMNVDLLSSQVNELSTHIDTVVVSTITTVLRFHCDSIFENVLIVVR